MRTYQPRIECRGRFEDPVSCQDVLAYMVATKEKELFGPQDIEGVAEPLPQIVASGEFFKWKPITALVNRGLCMFLCEYANMIIWGGRR